LVLAFLVNHAFQTQLLYFFVMKIHLKTTSQS